MNLSFTNLFKKPLFIPSLFVALFSYLLINGENIKYKPNRSYVVVANKKTYEDTAWKKVILTLRKKYNGALVLYTGSIWDVKDDLSRLMPRYACFVAPPGELGRKFVVSVHRLTRKLDNDPYTDLLWGILTGYEPSDALRIAGRKKPLVIRRGLGGTSGLNLAAFDEAIKYSEGSAGGRWVKHHNGKEMKEDFPVDSTKGLVDGFNKFKPDLFMTSGHASPKDWMIGYNYKDGFFICKDGQLLGRDTKGKLFPINSPNSKVFLPVGNCLIGNIPDRNCMALAMMHSAGVDQMFGYTAVTFFGYMGWGIKSLFEGQRDHYTLSESFYFNNQALVHELQTRFKRIAGIDFESYSHNDINKMVKKYNIRTKDEIGFLWDRDVVAFYGDPAWVVRFPPCDHSWTCSFAEKKDLFCFRIKTKKDGNWGNRPVMSFFPERLLDIKVKKGKELKPLLCDNFILLPLKGKFSAGEEYNIIFSAKKAHTVRTSASSAPIISNTGKTKTEKKNP